MQDKEKGFYIFRTWITNSKTGERIYAKDKGKKAFRIWIKNKKVV